ncbi:acyltransferase domain-containing protein [Dictyobacter vulcani]|nr:acyltransferase domain-containing protein [Dictyobacter vulcani]
MARPIVFMFSGQGSQYYHMGKELFKNHAGFRQHMLELDTLLFQYTGRSIVNEIYNDHKSIADTFDTLFYTHPAIFIVEYALCRILLEMGIKPDYLLGSSLGEFTAAAISGIMPIEDMLEFIVKQVAIFEAYCAPGNMIAILHNYALYYAETSIHEYSELTSINYPSHFVVSVDKKKLAIIIEFLKEKNIIYQLLPVCYGFHSSLVEPAEKAFKHFVQTKSYQRPAIPFVSCLAGEKLTEVSNDFFWNIVRKPILFQEAIQYLEKQHECIYVDLGPSGTLANFLKHSHAGNFTGRCYPIMTPFKQELRNVKTIESALR